MEYLFILVHQGCWGCEEKAIGKLQHCGRLQLLKRNQGWIFGSFEEKTFLDTPFKAEMCLWDNLGNSTDLHWEASIGQVSLLLILNLLCNDNLSLLRMPSGRAGLGLTRLTAALTEVEMHLLVDFLTH